MGRLSKMMAGIAHSAAAIWNRPPSFRSRAAWKRMGSSSFHASAAAAWKRSCPPSSYYLPPRRPVLPSFNRHGVHDNLSFHRKLWTSSNYKKCCCKDPLPDSQIDGFMYDDCEPPESINWRKLGMVTPVQDQVVNGVCWAYAATAAIESINAIKTGKLVKLSEQQIIDCNNLSNGGYFGGHAHMAFDYVVRNGGLVEDSVYPAAVKQCPCHKVSSHMVTIDGYQFVPRNDELALMKAVANQPIVVDIRMNDTLFNYKGGVAYDDGMRGELNHSVLLVAFDKTKKGEKFWVLKDSSGTKDRKKGYILIGRDTGRVGGGFGITEFPCFPVKTSENCEGFVDDDLSLYHNLYGGKSAEQNEDTFDFSSTGDDRSSLWRG